MRINKECIETILIIITFPFIIIFAFWLSYRINQNYRTICENNNGIYIEESYGLGEGKCIYDKD